MTINDNISNAVRRALLMGAVAATGSGMPVIGAEPTPATTTASTNQNLEEVVITGSRISRPNLTNTSPIMQVTAADIRTQGVTRIEDLITQLPQAFAQQNSTVSNGSNGTATVNLRELGDVRTLVLIDGRRMPYGAVNSSAADLNMVPTAMVERVDILTGGSSAVYGSDAVAGVVNFIMKKNFEGVQIDAQAGMFQHHNNFGGPGAVKVRDVIAGRAATNPAQFKLPASNLTDGQSRQINLTVGVNSPDGKGNLTAYAGVRTNNAVLERDRDFSACTLGAPAASFPCGGSSTSYPGRFFAYDNTGNLLGSFTVDQTTGNTFRKFKAATDQYNFGPLNYFQRPDTTYTAGAMGHYELSTHADVYTQLMYTDYESVAQIAPGGDFGEPTTVNCNNPFLSAQQQTTLGCSAADVTAGNPATVTILRRNIEGGGRQQSFHNETFRGVAGVQGDIASGWKYDASLQFSRLSATQLTLAYFVKPRIQNALNVVNVNGVPTCKSVVNGTDPTCVPYNIFQLGQVTPAALNYIQAPGLQLGVIDQKIASFNVTGDFGAYGGKFPWAKEPIAASFGYETRRESLNNTPDSLLTTNSLSGAGGATIGIKGATKSDDMYTEFRLPIADSVAGAHDLSVDLAYRYSDYGNNLTTSTYKAGIEWAPIADVRLRASYQRAVRAPNIIELFTAQGGNLFDLAGDPCGAGARDSNATAAKCIATGVPAINVGSALLDSPAGQYQFLQGGNQALQPEVSNTTDFGIVFQPRFAPGLSFTADYFDIKIDKTISTFGSNNTLNACYDNNDAAACARIHRGPTGSLWLGTGFVSDLNINIGSLKTRGIDFELDYNRISLGKGGTLGINITSTEMITRVTNPGPGLSPYECASHYSTSCLQPKPKWRHHARFTWNTPVEGLDVSGTWRYLSAVTTFNGTAARLDYTLGAQSYFDLAFNYAFTAKAGIHGGVNNLLDRDPPISAAVGTTGNGNTFPQTYDALGRQVFVGVTYKF